MGYVLALTQFLMVLVLGIMYLSKSENVFDPLAEKAIARYADEHPGDLDGITGDDSLGDQVDPRPPRSRRPSDDADRSGQRHRARDLRDRPLDHARDHLLGVQADDRRGHLLRRRPQHHRLAERPGDLRRLPVGRLVPGHRRPDLPVRVRRLPVLDRLPRRLPDGDVPARRAHAQRGQVHDRRRARVPPARAARAPGRGDRHAGRRRLLPDRADGRRGRAHPGARRHRLHPVGPHHRHVHALLRRLRRHARHDVGADHQGRAADDGHRRDVDLRLRQDELQPDRAVQPGGGRTSPRSPRSRWPRARS